MNPQQEIDAAAETTLARSLRLAVTQNIYDSGYISEADARELLRGCLTPGDESTRYDDSGDLKVKPEDAKRLEERMSEVKKRYALTDEEIDKRLDAMEDDND